MYTHIQKVKMRFNTYYEILELSNVSWLLIYYKSNMCLFHALNPYFESVDSLPYISIISFNSSSLSRRSLAYAKYELFPSKLRKNGSKQTASNTSSFIAFISEDCPAIFSARILHSFVCTQPKA